MLVEIPDSSNPLLASQVQFWLGRDKLHVVCLNARFVNLNASFGRSLRLFICETVCFDDDTMMAIDYFKEQFSFRIVSMKAIRTLTKDSG